MRRFYLICISFILCSQLSACSAFEFPSRSASTAEQPVSANAPKKVFVLLPLQGKYGESGLAVRNGFMAAFYANKSTKGAAPTIKVLDTSNQNISTVYQQAVSQGADLIVGPLDKDQLQTLIKATTLTVPTLALNTVTNQNVPNLYQFSLSQVDESAQAAERAYQNGQRRALVIAPAGSWGTSIVNRFKERWQQQGGVIVDEVSYQNPRQISEQIRQVLHVENSKARRTEPKQVSQEESTVVVHRRQDIDMIFLVAEPTRAREIAPLLKFYYAGNLPVYATSSIFSGVKNPDQDDDLNNIQFADMPWVLESLPADLQSIQQNVNELWKTSYSQNPKLYALGVDAYQLSTYLNQPKQFPHDGLRGATGLLQLQENQHISRELRWAKFRQGNPSILQ